MKREIYQKLFKLLFLLIVLCTSTYATSQQFATPRIYYHGEKLIGNPIETKKINLKKFDSILKNAHQEYYKVGEKSRLILVDGEFESVNVEMFKYCSIRKDGITYESKEGSFYLPEAIVLYDISDYHPYPSEFYFIAKINNQLELCRCSGGEGIEWHQMANRISTVKDVAIIDKAEETIDYLEGFVAYLAEEHKEAEAEKELKIANRPPLGEKTKTAYKDLTNICMPASPRKGEVLSFIDELKQYDDGESYGTTYNEFRMYLNRNLIPLIITVDWKESVDELEAWISSAVEENFNKTFRFDPKGKYNEDSTVSDDALFATFDKQLRSVGLQIRMIETDGDEYQLFVHPIDQKDAVNKAIETIGISFGLMPE